MSAWHLPGCTRFHADGERCDCHDRDGIWRCRCGTYNRDSDPDPGFCGNEACRSPRSLGDEPAPAKVPTPREVYLEGRVAELEHRLEAAQAQIRGALAELLGPLRHGERRP